MSENVKKWGKRALAVVVVIVAGAGVFFGGRWVYRKLRKKS